MLTNDIDFVQHDYHDNDFIGIVMNNKDTTFSGRCQIKVLGLFDGIPVEHLPWAIPINSTIFAGNGAGSISVPKIGHFVRVQFNNGDQYAPEYHTIQNIDTELIQRIKDDYEGTQVLLYDPSEELTVIYQINSGFQIFLKESFIQITNDALIILQTPNGDSVVQMNGDVTNITTKNEVKIAAAAYVEIASDEIKIGGNNTSKIGNPPYSHALLAEPVWGVLSALASMVDAKLPATPGIAVGIIEAAKQSATSTNVMIGT